ncbi:hypothetical protein K1T71_005902 [Dendrolimus kikuchii]|uniref:Uncharacterized protein n=1 Tax=Dendrolimus kikuchii TaxID=765133 RepID=A0ACC1D288_9NEOP|nr:hypothetical protein K1T71_005902 [Dendrolimus kikuchii]
MLILLLLNLLGEKDTQALYVEEGYQDLLNGNLTDLSYMYLSNDSDEENETDSAPPQRHLDREYEEYLFDANPEDCDLLEYNLLTKKVVNISRRGIPNRHLIENYGWYGGGWSWRDLSDAMYRPFWVNHEVIKKQKLIDLCIQFLIHIRLLLRHYQHVVRIDVDIRDIQAQIREVYSQEQPCDFVTKRSNTESTP